VFDSDYWARYYAVTAERPAWPTLLRAIELFAAENASRQRLAVDLGCGAGRDTLQLLNAGWRVLAVDRERAAIAAVEEATPADLRVALEARVADLADVGLPDCDLVNASLSLPFLPPDAYWRTWRRILDALPVGGRFCAMVFGDRDESAAQPSMTCPSPVRIRDGLASFELEHWSDTEEDRPTALGEPHHFHLVEFVARRVKRG
jgi:tellurite methyltransferase